MIPERLETFHLPRGVRKVLEQLSQTGFQAFLVGGCVRDMLRGLVPKDYDVTTSALPEEVQRLFKKVIPTGLQHGTVTVLQDGLSIEVTTFRSEGSYVDGRRPTSVSFHSDVREDLARRDFTMNAMAFDPVKLLWVDPFGGQADLAAGIIRAVGKPIDRFSEDGLRALRAVRFAAVLGFALEVETQEAIPLTLNVFRKVSSERIREEFTKLLLSDRAGMGLRLLSQSGLLSAFLSEAMPNIDVAQLMVVRAPKHLEIRLALLLSQSSPVEVGNVLRRLTYSSHTVKLVMAILNHQAQVREANSVALARRAMAECGVDVVDDILEFIEAQAFIPQTQLRELFKVARKGNPPLSSKDLALSGHDIMKILQVGAGPSVGQATRHLMDIVLEAPEKNQPETLTAEILRWKAGKAE